MTIQSDSERDKAMRRLFGGRGSEATDLAEVEALRCLWGGGEGQGPAVWTKGETETWTRSEVMVLTVLLVHAIEASQIKGLSIAYIAHASRTSARAVTEALTVLADPAKAGVLVRHLGPHAPHNVDAYEINVGRLAYWQGKPRPEGWTLPRVGGRSRTGTVR